MQRPLSVLMAVSGSVLGIFIVFSREPVAGAVIGGVLSTVRAIGLFFLSAKEQKANEQALIKSTAESMLWFYGTLVATCGGLLAVSFASWFPTNLSIERSVIESFLSTSNLKVIEVNGKQYQLDRQASEAATALVLTNRDLSNQATGIRVFGSGDILTAPDAGGYIGGDYCSSLKKFVVSNGKELADLSGFEGFTQNASARLAAKMLQAMSADKILVFSQEAASVFCKEG